MQRMPSLGFHGPAAGTLRQVFLQLHLEPAAWTIAEVSFELAYNSNPLAPAHGIETRFFFQVFSSDELTKKKQTFPDEQRVQGAACAPVGDVEPDDDGPATTCG